MQGIIITTHGPMAQGVLDSSKLFFGEQPQMKALCLHAEDNPDEFVEALKAGIAEVDTGDGVLVFCDIPFGSPCNCMSRIIAEDLQSDKIQVVTGVNLPMILQVLSSREAGKVEVQALLDAGNEAIADFNALLKSMM